MATTNPGAQENPSAGREDPIVRQILLMRWVLFALVATIWVAALIAAVLDPSLYRALSVAGVSGLMAIVARSLFPGKPTMRKN
jgi:hypothetical protein